ncbi:MAG: hypothetical protein IKX71_04200 [Bacteroidales bacterium]|nr:hypothetical protein [Bacteroidales bacterium]
MKKILSAIAALTIVAVMTTSCGLLGGSSANQSTASAGTTTGSALTQLLAQYLKDGSLDFTNLSNLINLATVANSIQNLKGKLTNSKLADFASGLVTGSNNQISDTNSSTITTILANLANNVDLSSLASLLTRAGDVTEAEAAKVAQTDAVTASTSALNNIFKLMSAAQ